MCRRLTETDVGQPSQQGPETPTQLSPPSSSAPRLSILFASFWVDFYQHHWCHPGGPG